MERRKQASNSGVSHIACSRCEVTMDTLRERGICSGL